MAPPRKCDCGECSLCRERDRRRELRKDPAVREKINAYQRSEKARARSRKRRSYPSRGAAKRWHHRNKEKARAHRDLRREREAGRIVPGPCEVCGATPTEGHHDDYSKPLEVRWLCRPCHVEHHRLEREAARVAA